jgi:hypothetical protein
MVRETKIFQSEATEIGNGEVLRLTNYSANATLTLSVEGTATSRTVNFEGKAIASNDWVAIKCLNLATGNSAVSSEGTTSEIWQTSFVGLEEFRVRISAIDGGNLTVIGSVVE